MSWSSYFDLLDPLPAATASFSLYPYKRTPATAAVPSLIDPFYDEAFLVEDRMVRRSTDHFVDILDDALGFPCRFPALGLDLFDLGRFGVLALEERVAALELGLEERERKYKWAAEIGGDRKYTIEAAGKAGGKRSVKWTEEYRGRSKDAAARSYSFKVSSAAAPENKKKKKSATISKSIFRDGAGTTRVVEITDPKAEEGATFLKRAFEKRTLRYARGKSKELSPEDAAMLIQMSFRAHLIRRSQVLRGLRELAAAKAKLKEVRGLFCNFSYRRLVAADAEERKRFSDKFIVLLVTLDSIQAPDHMVRTAKKSMVEELETMLEMIDPQNPWRLGNF